MSCAISSTSADNITPIKFKLKSNLKLIFPITASKLTKKNILKEINAQFSRIQICYSRKCFGTSIIYKH